MYCDGFCEFLSNAGAWKGYHTWAGDNGFGWLLVVFRLI